ncbi:MAG: alpha/beta fold hydrolase, partial [Candidatus Nanopelagicales bacterium]
KLRISPVTTMKLLVLVAPMIASPGEAPADYLSSTKYEDEARELCGNHRLVHAGCPAGTGRRGVKAGTQPVGCATGEPSPLQARPDVPTRVLICRDDRLFPPSFLRRIARERLGITPDEMDGGHTPALSRPHELAERLDAYAAELSS